MKSACFTGATGIQIVSDIHLEYRKKGNFPIITRHAENLGLLGDIGKPFMESYGDFLSVQSAKFEHVFVVMGNHEYYHSEKTVDQVLAEARQTCLRWNNVHLLEHDKFDLTDKTTVLGCTLWSKVDKSIARAISDTTKIKIKTDGTQGIKRLDVDTMLEWHQRDIDWIRVTLENVKEEGRNAVVLTHHAPLMEMLGTYQSGRLHSAYASDLQNLFKPPLLAWASGHVHSNCDIEYNGIRSVSNTLGYPKEDTGYKKNVVIYVP